MCEKNTLLLTNFENSERLLIEIVRNRAKDACAHFKNLEKWISCVDSNGKTVLLCYRDVVQ